MKYPFALGLLAASFTSSLFAESGDGWVTYPGGAGPGAGKHVVLLAGDEEYRSEEALPMLGKILSERHGFKCTVLFSVNEDGTINPDASKSVGKPEAIDSADVIVMSLRFRDWPDEALAHFDKAIQRGVPVVALRTSTHAFKLSGSKEHGAYTRFGEDVLGSGWVSHWGNHKGEATRGVIEPGAEDHPILNGVEDVFGDTDVYEAYPPEDAAILLRGRVLQGMSPDDGPAEREKKRASDGETQNVNDPMMPVAWTREVKNKAGGVNKIVTTTMGSSTDLASEGLRRFVVNGVFWGLEMEVPEKADVELVGEYEPTAYSFGGYKKGVKASDHELAD